MNDSRAAYEVRIAGLVQGVGFRPYVYRLAQRHHLCGSVENRIEGVFVRVEGTRQALEMFLAALPREAPSTAEIESIESVATPPRGMAGFVICGSNRGSGATTRISPDLAVCAECLEDMQREPRRRNYPFTNCTNCGPRFSIVCGLPYDRARTTMRRFRMCGPCRNEYHDIGDRRFHAQPVACRDCGPQYTLTAAGKPEPPKSGEPEGTEITDMEEILAAAAGVIEGGGIVAMKGIGGFQLACDALQEQAVRRLRERKRREAKPFAVLFRDLDALEAMVSLDDVERRLLCSVRRPIVLLRTGSGGRGEPSGAESRRPGDVLQPAPSVANGLDTLGAMLPYTPLQHLLFQRLKTPAIVLTSGNISSEPIVIDNSVAGKKLVPLSDALLMHNRAIHNRLDDSVAMVVAGRARMLRRSRGYVPNPIRLPFDVEGIVAVGAGQKNVVCFGRGNEAFLSQHIGDLDDNETLTFFEETLARYPELFEFKPRSVACDLHPDYLSTAYAERSGLPVTRVQHHHAHIAACLAENGREEPVIGVALDGTGYGDDGAVWGGEILIAHMAEYERFAHFDYIPLPGGDTAIRQPWRVALAYLRQAYGGDAGSLSVPSLSGIPEAERNAVINAIEQGINTPLTSSAGRLFDAVAVLTGLGTAAQFDAEGPMRLAALLPSDCEARGAGCYPFETKIAAGECPANGPEQPARSAQAGAADRRSSVRHTFCFDQTIRSIIADLGEGRDLSLISARFHNTIVDVVRAGVWAAGNETGLSCVALSGGVFQNRYIAAQLEERLSEDGFSVLSQGRVPSNDGGIALGQLAVAAHRRNSNHVLGNTGKDSSN